MLPKKLSIAVPTRGAISATPADKWQFAFVTGNGRMGAMLYGQPQNERLIANHCRLFLPRGSREILPDMAEHVPKLREIIRTQGYEEALEFFLGEAQKQGFPGLIWTDPFHPGFEVKLKQEFQGDATDYLRTENFETGEVEVRWRAEAGAFRRRLIVSRPHNVIAFCMTGPSPGMLNGRLSVPTIPAEIGELLDWQMRTDREWITLHNVYRKGKGGYDAAVRIAHQGGAVISDGQSVEFRGTDTILMLMRIKPFRKLESSNVEQLKADLAGLPVDYETLLAAHADVHGEIFGRVTLDLGGGADRQKTSEELLDIAAATKHVPPALLEKMHDAGRYMLICAGGETAPNLQGIWTGTWSPSWSGDYTLDTNVQAAIGAGLSCNLLESMAGYYDLIESFLSDWRENARKYYGARGVFACPRASNNGLHLHWGNWPGVFWTAGAGWLSHWFYDHYRYTGDREFLANRTVPLLKQIALFYEDFLLVDENGTYEFIPSYNPETGSGINATMDIAVARQVLRDLIEACEVLGIEQESIPKWKAMRDNMPAYGINDKGELAEWASPRSEMRYGHRHCSGLYPAFQSFELTPEETPQLWKAAQAATRKKGTATDSQSSSFSRMQSGLAAAYLGLAEEAYTRLAMMATHKSMYPSLITSHNQGQSIFNTDGNGSIPELFNMMVLFSWPGRLDLLPALPDALPRGSLSGILARGQIKVDRLEWDRPAGRIQLTLTSRIAQSVELRLPQGTQITEARVLDGEAVLKGLSDTPNCRELTLPAEQTIRVCMTSQDGTA